MSTPDPYIEGFLQAFSPPDTRLPTDWAADNLIIAHSERLPGKFDPLYAPWLIRPINILADPNCWASSLMKPVQGGGTQALEIYYLWRLANDPRPCIITGQTDKDIENLVQDKFLKTMKASPIFMDMIRQMPADAMRKDRLDFPMMVTDIQGPGGNKTQSKTRPINICDEIWRFDPGVLGMLKKRMDAATGQKMFACSQAGRQIGETQAGDPIWDEWGNHWHQGTQEVYRVRCLGCGKFHELETHSKALDGSDTPCGMIWDGRAETGRWNLREVRATTRWKCPGCFHEHHPGKTKDERQAYQRHLISDFDWLQTNPDNIDGHFSFRYSVWNVWWKDWGEMAEEYLLAKAKLRAGDIKDFENWTKQREARFWTFKMKEVPVINNRPASGYTMEEYTPSPLPTDGSVPPLPPMLENEKARHMAVDVQRDCYKVVIRAFGIGRSRQLLHKTVHDWDGVRELQLRYRVPNNYVAVDAGKWKDDVYKACIKYGWRALVGRDVPGFTHVNKKRGRREDKPYSTPGTGKDPQSKNDKAFCYHWQWSNVRAKDILARLQAGLVEDQAWELPDDMDQEMIEAMESEVKDPVSGIWKQVRKLNHYWDGECMILIIAMISNTLEFDADIAPNKDSEESDPEN